MINVDVVYSTWLTNHVGPSKSLTRFKKNKEIFDRHNVSLRIITADLMNQRDFSQRNQNLKSRVRSKLISFVLFLSNYSSFLTWKVIKSKYLSHSKRIVDYYGGLSNRSNIVVFHELYTAYYFLNSKFYDKKKHKVILYHHANGEMFKMLTIYHPLLEKSKYMSNLYDIQKFVLNYIDRLVFISNNARINFLSQNPTFEENRAGFIYNGIEDLSEEKKKEVEYLRMNAKRDFIQLVCAGTINTRKGQEILVRAFAKADEKQREKLKIYFLGNGPQKSYLEDLVIKLGISKHFVFTGGVNNVDQYLAESDIFILPSKDEGLPISIIEAMRVSLPIISTNVAGIPEMIDHEKNGLLTNPDENSMVKILNAIDKYNWKEMGKISRGKYEDKFTLEKMINGYCSVIKQTLE